MAAIGNLIKDMDAQQLLTMIRVAEAAERYEDMCRMMKQLVEMKSKNGQILDVDERNLLSVSYKNAVGAKRTAWRTLNDDQLGADESLIKYRKVIEDEVEAICNEVIDLLKTHLISNANDKSDETKVFYLKMCADYHRYLCEAISDKFKEDTESFYNQAMEVAKDKLKPTHPTRLGLALNFSVCYYEILKEPMKAKLLAKSAFDSAIASLDQLDDDSYKDSTLIMQLLRDNLTLWTQESDDEDE